MLLISLWALCIAVISYTYKEIIGREAVLNWWFKFGLRFENRFFYRPIWGCEKCFAGQTAMWIFILNLFSTYFNTNAPFWRLVFFFIPKYEKSELNLFMGFFSASLAVLLTFLISKTIKKINYD